MIIVPFLALYIHPCLYNSHILRLYTAGNTHAHVTLSFHSRIPPALTQHSCPRNVSALTQHACSLLRRTTQLAPAEPALIVPALVADVELCRRDLLYALPSLAPEVAKNPNVKKAQHVVRERASCCDGEKSVTIPMLANVLDVAADVRS